MPVIEVNGVAYAHPGGQDLFSDVSFRVPSGKHVGIIGANGTGKTTLLKLITGALAPSEGSVFVDAPLQLMPQSVGATGTGTVAELLGAFASPHLSGPWARLILAEQANDLDPSERTGIELAEAVNAWGEVNGYHEEARWDTCCQQVLRQAFDQARERPVAQLSGGERKRLVLESLFASDLPILLLDEPDNFLDIMGKRWLEEQIVASSKTILFISHDRELLARSADQLVVLEGRGSSPGRTAGEVRAGGARSCWVHPASFATFEAAREARNADLEGALARWTAEERRLFQYYKLMKQRASISEAMAARADAAESRWERFVAAGPPPPPPTDQRVHMDLRGSRSGERVVTVEALELEGLTDPFDVEIYLGDRVAVLGPNGSGKSHFLRLLGGDATVESTGSWRTGASVHVGLFHQTDEVAWLAGRTPLESLATHDLPLQAAMAALARYGLTDGADRPYETLSGGQQARLQILGLEIRGVNLLLLDEPTDNLDLLSAEELEAALGRFTGTVMCVTHDRWFLRQFDRFVVFDHDCSVKEALDVDTALHLVTGDPSFAFSKASVKDLVTRA